MESEATFILLLHLRLPLKLEKTEGFFVTFLSMVREVGLEPTRPKTQVPKTCVSAISPLPQGWI